MYRSCLFCILLLCKYGQYHILLLLIRIGVLDRTMFIHCLRMHTDDEHNTLSSQHVYHLSPFNRSVVIFLHAHLQGIQSTLIFSSWNTPYTWTLLLCRIPSSAAAFYGPDPHRVHPHAHMTSTIDTFTTKLSISPFPHEQIHGHLSASTVYIVIIQGIFKHHT